MAEPGTAGRNGMARDGPPELCKRPLRPHLAVARCEGLEPMALRRSTRVPAVKFHRERGRVSRLSRALAGVAGALLAAAVPPAADGGAVTVGAGGGMAALRLGGQVPGLTVPLKVLSFTELNGVFCVSASDCFARGERQMSGNAPELNQVLRWNGTKWRLFPVPQPGGRKRGDFAELNSVRCLTALDCWAVGYYAKAGADFNEALHWNGTKWSQAATPAPGGTSDDDFSELNDVVCTSHANCWAVGDFSLPSAGPSGNQAVHWNGRTWALRR